MATWFSVIRVPAIASVRHTLQWVKDIFSTPLDTKIEIECLRSKA